MKRENKNIREKFVEPYALLPNWVKKKHFQEAASATDLNVGSAYEIMKGKWKNDNYADNLNKVVESYELEFYKEMQRFKLSMRKLEAASQN